MFPLSMNGEFSGDLENPSDLSSVKADITAYLKEGGFETEVDGENVYFQGALLMSGKLLHRVSGIYVGKGQYAVTLKDGKCRIKYNISTIRIFGMSIFVGLFLSFLPLLSGEFIQFIEMLFLYLAIFNVCIYTIVWVRHRKFLRSVFGQSKVRGS